MEFDESEPEPIVSPDTQNASKFHPEEAEGPKHQWQRDALLKNRNVRTRYDEFKKFRWMNNGRGDRRTSRGNTKLHQMMDRKQRFDAISSQLDMTPYQKRLGREVRDSKPLRKMGGDDEYLAFCLCAFICRNGRYAKRTPESERKLYYPDRPRETNDERFVNLAESLGLDKTTIKKCMGRMNENVPDYLSWS